MFSKSLSSIGKHRSASSRVHDNMLLAQMKDIYFLFFFKNGEYREILLDDVAWPEKMSYDSRASIKKDEIVHLYFEGDFCPGRFIAKGDLETLKLVCEKMDPRIECSNTTEDRANLSFNAEIIAASQALSQPQPLVKRSYVALRSLKEGTARNAKKMRNDDEIHVLAQKSYKTPVKSIVQSKLPLIGTANSSSNNEKENEKDGFHNNNECSGSENEENLEESFILNETVPKSDNENVDGNAGSDQSDKELDSQGRNAVDSDYAMNKVVKAIKGVTKVMDAQRRELRELRMFMESQLSSGSCSSQLETRERKSLGSVWHNGEDMTKIERKTPKKYGRNLARKYFTEEEMLSQRSNPRKSNSLPSLNAEVLEKIKGLVEGRFPSEWTDAYEGIDDLGRDLKKKKIRQQQKQEANKVNGAEAKNDNNPEGNED